MIGIFINDDVIRIPHPAVHISYVVRRNHPIPAMEPEAIRAATFNSPNMVRAESPSEVAMFPWMVEMIVRIIASCVVPDPCAAVVNVRGVRMPGLIAEVAIVILLRRRRLAMIGLGTMRRRLWGRRLVALMMLCEQRRSEEEAKRSQRMLNCFHQSLLTP
jgi:hypothetical protein